MYKSLLNVIVALNIVAAVSCIALAYKVVALPMYAEKTYKAEYKELIFQCDNSMREHMIAKNRVLTEKSEDSVKRLNAAEVGLLSCNSYDKLRKRLLTYGISESDLALFGIEAIEEKAEDVRNFVKIHEFKY